MRILEVEQMSKFKHLFTRSYQEKVGDGHDDVLQKVSEDIVSFLTDLNIIQHGMKIFEIGAAGCRNLRHIYDFNNNIELYANDLHKDASFKNMDPRIREVIHFYEMDTLALTREMTFEDIDLLISSYHLMHIDDDSWDEIIENIKKKWKPKYIFLNELIMREFPGHY
ncbi:MAG: hypothetical protein JSV09_16325, partial [Thermoplasmata archaeon]